MNNVAFNPKSEHKSSTLRSASGGKYLRLTDGISDHSARTKTSSNVKRKTVEQFNFWFKHYPAEYFESKFNAHNYQNEPS